MGREQNVANMFTKKSLWAKLFAPSWYMCACVFFQFPLCVFLRETKKEGNCDVEEEQCYILSLLSLRLSSQGKADRVSASF